ncbi:MAG: 2-octaprenyl-6-methoxyphenyl hydroxylase [Gammaproteobacteria bacterium]|nr:2-octaprenyl-6-methoxyphenyl hydroxylase [Gammaproteobacteria bacterium]
MSAVSPDCDVLIAGGGLVGASLAVALAPLGIRIGLVEAVPPGSDDQPSFDDRTIALSRGSQQILDAIGVWNDVAAEAVAINEIHVSEKGRFGTAQLSAREQGVPALGHVVASRELGRALWSRVSAFANVRAHCPARLSGPAVDAGAIRLQLEREAGPVAVSTGLLVVAEGARSGLRQALGIDASETDYGQVAIVGNVAVAGAPSDCVAHERFTADGPLALLPWRHGRYAFVLARRREAAADAMKLADGEFLALLDQAFGRRLGRFESLGRRSCYPLSLVRAGRIVAPRAAVIGNAAHGLHPVAGQGFNLGLRDVATLAEVVADAVRDGQDHGGAALERYAAWRGRDQRNVVAFTDGLIRLFDLPLAATGVARGAGLALFDILPPVKRLLARETMGLGGRMTRLARGLPL